MTNALSKDSIVAGIHSVGSLLSNSPGKVNHLVVLKNSGNKRLHELQKLAERNNIRVHQLPLARLNSWYNGKHQGALAFCNHRILDDWEKVKKDLLQKLKDGGNPCIVLSAAMEDPRNLGACIRSAVAFGIDAVLYPGKGTCGLTPAAAKASAGASSSLPVCRVQGLQQELLHLKSLGFRIYGLEHDSQYTIHEQRYESPCIFVIGGEDKGIPPHIRRLCDKLLSIPMTVSAHSLNASVALSILLYEVNRQSGFSRLGVGKCLKWP